MTRIYPKDIAEAIYDATEGKSKQDTELALKHSLQILVNKQMFGKSEEILEALQNIFDKKSGIVRVKVTTAKKIKHETKSKIEKEVQKRYMAQKVISEFFEQEELLGGMRLEVEDEVLDTTYRNKLNQLEKFLIREN